MNSITWLSGMILVLFLWLFQADPRGQVLTRGITLPTTCEIGEIYVDTDAPLGVQLFICSVSNTWTLQGIPQGAIVLIDSGTCLSGFSEVAGANGRFPIGTLAVNSNVGTTGTQVAQSGAGVSVNFVRVIACKKD